MHRLLMMLWPVLFFLGWRFLEGLERPKRPTENDLGVWHHDPEVRAANLTAAVRQWEHRHGAR